MLTDLTLPAVLTVREQDLTLRSATEADLDPLVELLSDDEISSARGDVADPADRPAYLAALRQITADPANVLLVVCAADGQVVGTMQLTRIPGMARRGARRLLVEAVRVSGAHRSGGIGAAMMRWVIDTAAPQTGSTLIQLTSDARRTDAHRFYERLGFVGSHLGFKYEL